MKVIVTGALGHIGSALIRKITSQIKEIDLVLIDDMSANRYCSLFNLPQARYTFIESKVTDCKIDEILQGADVVVHLAALTDAAGTSGQPEVVYKNNFDSTKFMADACLRHNVAILFPSSTSVYGSQSELVDETCQELLPQSPYADSKIQEEKYLKELFLKGLRGNIFRFGTIHGKSEGMRFHTAVNKFCWQAVTKQPVTVWETAIDQKRPYLAIEDAVEVVCWVISKGVYDKELYNVATENLTVRQIIDEIKVFVPSLDIIFVKHKIMNQLSYEVSSEKIKLKGFKFSGSYKKSIKETIQNFKNINGLS